MKKKDLIAIEKRNIKIINRRIRAIQRFIFRRIYFVQTPYNNGDIQFVVIPWKINNNQQFSCILLASNFPLHRGIVFFSPSSLIKEGVIIKELRIAALPMYVDLYQSPAFEMIMKQGKIPKIYYLYHAVKKLMT